MISKSRYQRTMATLAQIGLAVAACASSFANSPVAGAATSTSLAQFQADATSIIQPYVSAGGFSGSVLLESHGRILLNQGYGAANLTTKKLNTPDTRFAISALTQGFTAVAILRLMEQGKLKLSDPVSKYIANLPSGVQPVTLDELLTQTSGAPPVPNGSFYKAGTKFQYSILNYSLLGQVVAKASGESFQTYVEQHIIEPLGMTNTGFISTMDAVPNSATGYAVGANNWIIPTNLQASSLASTDGLYSTTADLLKWDQALYTNQLLSTSSLRQMFTPSPLSVDALKTYGYGFGWEVSLGGQNATDEGSVSGFHALLHRDMQNDLTIIILSNRVWAPVGAIAARLNSLLLGNPLTAPASSVVSGVKQIVINGSLFSRPYGRVAFATTHMPIWYIGQALQKLGIKQTWDGAHHQWILTVPPSMATHFSGISLGSGNTDIIVNGRLVKRVDTYAWLDPSTGYKSSTVYAPIFYIQQILTASGVHTSWNGTIWTASNS